MENGCDDDPLETFWALGNKVRQLTCLDLNMNHMYRIQETRTKHKYDKQTFHNEPRASFVAPPIVTTSLRIVSLFKLVSLL